MQRTQVIAFSPTDFAEDTDFERFVVARLGTHRARPPEPGSIHDLRQKHGTIYVKVGSVVAGTELVEELRRSLRPLAFGAAYKVLDLLIEHVLRANGAPLGRLSFVWKRNALGRRPQTFPQPLNASLDVWDRLAALYIACEEARHAVTHRRAQVNAAGDLEIHDDQGKLVDTVASAEIEAFAAAVHTVAELIIDANIDQRRISIAAAHLNSLQARHRLGAIPAASPDTPLRRLVMDLEPVSGDCLRFDIARAKTAVAGQGPSLWDLELHADGRVFVGRWEDVPDQSAGKVDFNPAALPDWLAEMAAS